MSLTSIMQQISTFLMIALPSAAVISLLLFAVNKYIFKRKTRLWKLPVGFLLLLLIMFIFYLTFFTRVEADYGQADLHLLRSYREAWNSYSLRNWQLVLFNIAIFVPFGFLVPIVINRFRHFFITIPLGFLYSLSIELGQYLTGRGLCELDDLLNNTIGVVVGYFLFLFFYTICKAKKWKQLRAVLCLIPLLVVGTYFSMFFYAYDSQTYGNLAVDYTYQVDMKDVTIAAGEDLELSDTSRTVPVFQSVPISQDDAKAFAVDFFDRLSIEGKIKYYYGINTQTLTARCGDHQISIYLQDQSYDYYYLGEDYSQGDMGTQALIDLLNSYGITIPEDAIYAHPEDGVYEWTVERTTEADNGETGTIVATTSTDGRLIALSYYMIQEDFYATTEIISVKQAYENLINGYFYYDTQADPIRTLRVNSVTTTYSLDSKNYFQPVYVFSCEVNGQNKDLVVVAMPRNVIVDFLIPDVNLDFLKDYL